MQKPPTDDREAIEPHRKISGGYLRSKCGAQVCEANIEIIVQGFAEIRIP